jgi:hypothetical protein
MLNALVGNIPPLKFSIHQYFVLSADVTQSIPYRAQGETPVGQSEYSISTLQRYLKGTHYPASKEEVASNAQGNGATQELVEQITNADIERFESVEEVAQALSSPPPAPMDVG